MGGNRSLKDLYDHALITPVLKGSCRMQGPMDVSDNDLLVDMVEHQPKKRCGKNLSNDSVHKRAVSGTCNVCAAPCSSCMHNERMDSAMESNVEAAFPENTLKKGADNFSSVNFEGRPRYKSRICEDVGHAASEGSNFSVDSSNDSSSGNAESKITIRIPDIYDTSEGLDMPNKVLPSETFAEDGLHKRSIDCQSINTQNSLSSLSFVVPEPHLQPIFPCDKEKHVLGCDGDEKKHGSECPGDSNGNEKLSPVKNETSTDPSENAYLNGNLFSSENKQNHKDDNHANIGKSSHELLKEENGNSDIESESLGPLPESNRGSDDHSEPDVFEDDVKVCDICGDAGREEMLVFCSICSDGAEHTYCMRIMLDKVPEGDWLCEECKFKKQEDKKVFIPETSCGMTKEIGFNKSHQNFGSSNLGILSKLDNKPSPTTSVNPKDLCIVDSKPSTATNAIKDIHAVSERFFDNNEVTSTSRKVLDTKKTCILPLGKTKSTVKKAFSRENSFKSPDTGKVRAVEVKSAPALGTASTKFEPSSPKVQAQFHSPRGSLSRSSSDNLKLKPKHLTENVHKTKLLNGPPKINGKKDVMAKSASFKDIRPSSLNIDATVKGQCTNRSLDARNLTHSIDKVILERKDSHLSDRPRSSSSSTLSTITSSKKELKVSSRDEKVSVMSETNVVATKGSEDTHGSVIVEEMKQQTSLSEKIFLPNFTFEDQKQCRKKHSDKMSESVIQHGLLQPWQFSGRDMKSKSITSSAPRQAASATVRILKCQICNETGHATQSCSIDKVRSTALKPSGERNVGCKSSKWKDTVEAVISKSRFHNRIADQPDRPTFVSASYRKNISDDDRLLDVSSAFRNVAPLEGTSGMQESTGSFTTNVGKLSIQYSNKQKVLPAMETISVSSSDTVITSDALNQVSTMQMLTEKVSKNFSPSRISTIPMIPHIWQGSFELHKNRELCNLYDGVQAHLSTSASPKVVKVAGNFPCKLHLEEASYGDSWPSQFLRKPPTEEDIALFFFASDFESHQRNYTKLLDNILKKDLVLKGSLDGFELLIFPSTKLPQRSQCWNMLYFLWGVFRRKRTNCSEQTPDFRKICNLSTSPQGTVRDSTSAVVLAHGSFAQNEKSSRTELRSFDLNENSHDDKLIDEADSINHLPSKKHRTCFVSENMPTTTSMLTNDCSKQVGCGVHENSFLFPERSKAKSEDPLFGPTKVPQTISPGPALEEEKSKDYEIVIDLETIPLDSCEEKQDEFTENVRTGNKATFLGKNGVALSDILVRNSVQKLTDHTKVSKAGSASYQDPGHEKGKSKTAIDLESLPQDLPHEDDVHGGICWDARPNLKHIAYTPEPLVQASVETLWKEKDNLLLDQGNEPVNKKLKLSYDARGDGDNERVECENSEKFFFPVTSGSLTELKSGNSVPSQVVPLDEDVTHPNIPNLELALGAKKERRSQKILPLFLPLANSDHATPSDCVKNEDDSNLSLSLSFPSPKTESSSRGTKQLLLDKKELSSRLLLFRDVIDSGNR